MSCCQMEFDIEKMFLGVTLIRREIKDDFHRMKPLLIRRKALGASIRGVLSADHYCRAARRGDGATVRGAVTDACGWFVADKDRSRALDNTVGRSHTGGHIAHTCSRHKADEYGWAAWRQNRPSNMRNRRYTRCDHRAHMHITYSCCRRHFKFSKY